LLGVRVDRNGAFFALSQVVLTVKVFLSAQIPLSRVTFWEALICFIIFKSKINYTLDKTGDHFLEVKID